MSLLIRGMEMPSCCMFCPISNATGCGLMNPPVLMTSKEMLQGRPDWCPLVPVPPHGGLIDADSKSFPTPHRNPTNDYMKGWNACLRSVQQQPTIIPAEEGEK